MRRVLYATVIAAALGMAVFAAQTQAPARGTPPAGTKTAEPAAKADPYANNAAPGTTTFPLAAPAGKDSNALTDRAARRRESGAVRPGDLEVRARVQPAGGREDLESGQAQDDAGRQGRPAARCSAPPIPATYCAMANAGYDFIWTEMQHDQHDWEAVARMWRTCPNAKAVPGVRVAYTDEREIQHALDAGALVVVVPTVDTVEEAIEARNWTYFPPLGRRSNGGGQAFDASMWGGVPGGYRQTINDNIVLILMIETLEGLKNADEIAKVPGVTARLRRERRPRQLLRLPAGLARLRAGDQHRPRRRRQGRRAAVRSARLARPPGLHLLPGRQRNRRHRPRRGRGARTAEGYAAEAGSGTLLEIARLNRC